MPRTLDLTALRSLVAVAESGGVTRAAGRLNLTQSAVSMQIKRLEEAVGQPLLDRTGRGVTPTPQGEQLLTYARRMLILNDEAWARMTAQDFEGELVFGAPHDIIYPHIPDVMRAFAREFPRVKLNLDSSGTKRLKTRFAAGELDLILTTEDHLGAGGVTLEKTPLVWVGAKGGSTWRQRPLRLAFEHTCIFRAVAIDALEKAGLEWEVGISSTSSRTIEAGLAADLAIHVAAETSVPEHTEAIRHCGALPALPETWINMYVKDGASRTLADKLAGLIRSAYCKDRTAIAAE